MAETVRCASCGAAMRADAAWCGQCSAVPVRDEEPVVRRPVPEQIALATPRQYSRWRKSETSFGPVGRILWSSLVLAVGALFLWSRNPFAFVPWFLFAVPLVLRSVWARSRVT